MNLRQVISLTDAIGCIGRARSGPEVVNLFCDSLAPYGFTAALLSGLPEVEPAKWPRHIVLNRWPQEWYAYYNLNCFYSIDPCVDFARTCDEPFFWTDAAAAISLAQDQRQVMNAAKEFGLKQGICVPLARPYAAPAVVTVSGEEIDLPPDTLGIVQLLAINAFAQLVALEERHAAQGQPLSPREREILNWLADGKTVWEVSRILSLSHHTVGAHLRNARAKLNAVNITHCVVEAIRRGDIHL